LRRPASVVAIATPFTTTSRFAKPTAGSVTYPPDDLGAAAAAVNKTWTESWAKAIANAGVPTNRLYAHVAAPAGAPTDVAYEFINAPIDIAFIDSARPGWTSYPMGSLTKDFSELYDPLTARGNPHWGGTEGAPFDGLHLVSVTDYLSRHFDHGATVLVLNNGATGDLSDRLSQSIYSCGGLLVYQRFLMGP
jgi:hypothetical protein